MRQLWMRTTWVLLCVTAVWCQPAWLRADDESDEADDVYCEQLLPEEVLVFVSVPDVIELRERCEGSLLGSLIKDPQMQPFLDGVQAKLQEYSAKMKDESGLTVENLLDIPSGEITFALIDLQPRKLAWVMLLDYGDHQSAVDTLLGKMTESFQQNHIEAETSEIQDVPVSVFTMTEDPNNPFGKLAYFSHDNYLVMASDVAALEAVLARWDGNHEETFAKHDIHNYIQEKCSTEERDPLIKWYVNPIGLTTTIVGMMQAQFPQAGMAVGLLPILGLDKLKAVGGAADLNSDDYDAITRGFVYVDQPTTGLINIFQFPATDLAPPKWVPSDAAMYTAVNWNVLGAYTAVETLVDSFQGPGAFSRMVDQVAEEENGPGIHPKKDLIDQMDGQIHIVMGPEEEKRESGEEAVPKVMFAIDVKDASKMGALLSKASKSQGFSGTTREFEGTTIYELESSPGSNAALAMADKHLLISLDTTLLENALRPRSGVPSLSSNEIYKKLSSKFPKKVSMLSYQNNNSQLRNLYNMAKKGEIPGDIPADVTELLGKLPDFDVLQKYLRTQAGYTVPDKKGAFSASFSLKEEK